VKLFVNFVVKIFYHKGHKGLHKEHKVYGIAWYIKNDNHLLKAKK